MVSLSILKESRPPQRISGIILLATTVYLILFTFNSLTRTGRFSLDSMSYVNVAQNLLSGKGLTQPTVGFNQKSFSIDQRPPMAFTEQAPLYPVLIAFVSWFGMSPARSALLLSAFANLLILALIYRLGTALFNQCVGLIAATALLFYYPLRWIAGWALSDTLGISFLLLTLLLLVSRNTRAVVFLAGFVGGLAFAARYALAPLFAAGILFLLLNSRPWKSKIVDVGLFALGFALPAGAIVAHNFFVRGALMPFYPPHKGFWDNFAVVLQTTFGGYARGISVAWQLAILGASLLLVWLLLAIRGDFVRGLKETFISDRRHLLLLWSVAYLVFLIVQRSFSSFDVDLRTIAPAGVILVLMLAALLVRAFAITTRLAQFLALFLLLLAVWGEAEAAIKTPALDFQRTIARSGRLSWIAANASAKDLIIGHDVVDVPFYFNRTDTLSFSPVTNTEHPTYEKINAYAQKHCHEYDNIYLVLRTNPLPEKIWRIYLGDFFTDLIFERAQYPNVVPLQRLNDGLAFRIECK